jgi:hypothetical protein
MWTNKSRHDDEIRILELTISPARRWLIVLEPNLDTLSHPVSELNRSGTV